MQAITRNPLVDPGLLAVNAGAYVAMVVGFSLVGATSTAGSIPFAMAGALVATTLVHVVGDQKVSSLSVVKDERALVLDEEDEVNVALAAGTPTTAWVSASRSAGVPAAPCASGAGSARPAARRRASGPAREPGRGRRTARPPRATRAGW